MRSREPPSYSSSRVQRASRLNSLEHARLQHRLMLMEKTRQHQTRLTNQDIRLTSLALEYILNCSGHSPEGRDPEGQQGGVDAAPQEEDPCFLYGERVVSRKVRRMLRPQSAVERSTFRRSNGLGQDSSSASSASRDEDSSSVHSRLPPRPQSSPAKGLSWAWSQEDVSDAESDWLHSRGRATTPADSSRPTTAGSGTGWRTTRERDTPRQAWEDDTDDVTKRILKQQQQQQQHKDVLKQESLRADRYLQDLNRLRNIHATIATPTSTRSLAKQSRSSDHASPLAPSSSVSSPWTPAMIKDRKPMSPKEKRARSTGMDRRAGLTEIMSQARATVSANAWHSHLSSTQTVPRSLESQRQVILEAKKQAEKQRQRQVMQRVNTFIDKISKCS